MAPEIKAAIDRKAAVASSPIELIEYGYRLGLLVGKIEAYESTLLFQLNSHIANELMRRVSDKKKELQELLDEK